MMTRPFRPLLLCCALAACATPVCADDLLGIYVGAGVSRTDLRQDYYQIDSHATGWKLLAGWRPISFLGIEAEYADLGSKGVTTPTEARPTFPPMPRRRRSSAVLPARTRALDRCLRQGGRRTLKANT